MTKMGIGCVAVIVENDSILLLRRKGAHGEGQWAPPGGWLDFGESPEEAVVREVYEETGMRVRAVRRLGMTENLFREEGVQDVCFVIECTRQGVLSCDPQIMEPEKASHLMWHGLNHVAQRATDGALFPPFAKFVDRSPLFRPQRPRYIYVASSWRCEMQEAVVHVLRAAGLDCYDFKNPAEGDNGFRWTDVGLPRNEREGGVSPAVYAEAMEHPLAVQGFAKDFAAMERADACVLVLPCNRSAHLELGWFVGKGRRTAILCEDPMEPELMYKMVDFIATDVYDLLGWLGVED